MALKIKTPPAALPVTLEQAQRQSRCAIVGNGDPEASMWEEIWIPAAVARAESFQSRTYITTEYELTVDWCWPYAICLPRAPVQSIDSISYVDVSGVTKQLSSADYQADIADEPVYILPVGSWPLVRSQIAAITVNFTAGYGSAPSDVPADIKAAILLIAASLYEHREEVVVGDIGNAMPKSAETLLYTDRLFPPGHQYMRDG